MVWDIGTDGSGGGRPYFVTADEPAYYDTVEPGLLYEWTTSASGDVPAGVDEAGVLNLQLQSIGFSASFAERSVIPAGATLEQVLRWSDGTERVTAVDPSQMLSPVVKGEDFAGLSSVSLRVTGLPDGEWYEVTSTYDPSKTWAAACGTTLSVWPTAPPLPNINWGPYFEGPESAEFHCLAVLPREDEDVIPLAVETGTGPVSRTGSDGAFVDDTFKGDFGTGGVLVDVTMDAFPLSDRPSNSPPYPGWGVEGSSAGDDVWNWAMTFGALAWIDAEGRLIGREVTTGAEHESVMGGTTYGMRAAYGLADGRTRTIIVRKDLATAGVPCDGVDPASLAAASIVWVQGVGPDADHMTWSWTRVWPAPQS